MAISIKDDTYYTEQGKTAVKSARDTALKDNITLYTGQTDTTNRTYDAQVDVTGKAYDQSYRENAVQKAINERQVAESMANLGLTNSGLNRTQQTAIQLSYANNKAGIDKQKQSKIDALELARTQDLAKIEQNKLSSEAQINQYYDGLAQQYASEYKNADIDAYNNYVSNVNKQYMSNVNKQIEEESYSIKANSITLGKDMQGTLSKNNVERAAVKEDGVLTGYTYTDTKSGNSIFAPLGVNPYTGDDNYTKYKAVAKTTDDFFENGYQPKKVYVNGKDYGYVSDSGIKGIINGREQRVHKTTDGSYWMWDGNKNTYVKAETKHVYGEDTAGWTGPQYQTYFAKIRNTLGDDAAKEQYNEWTKLGFIPKNMDNYAYMGAYGKAKWKGH